MVESTASLDKVASLVSGCNKIDVIFDFGAGTTLITKELTREQVLILLRGRSISADIEGSNE